MSFALSKLFGSSPTSQPSQQPVNKGQQDVQGMEPSQNGDPSKQSGTEGQQGQAQQDTKSPLDDFKDLFNNEPTSQGDNSGQPQKPSADDPFYALDPDKLKQAASRQDFTQIENFDEVAQSALGGDINSLKTLLNSVSQNAFVSAAQLSGDIANRTTRNGLDRSKSDLPSQFKDLMSQDSLSETNEAFKHPAMAPMVNAIRQQFQQKFPDAGAKDIAKMTNDYLNAVTGVLNKEGDDPTQRSNPQQGQQSQGSTDFTDFFDMT